MRFCMIFNMIFLQCGFIKKAQVVLSLKRIVVPCLGEGETEVESGIVSWCSRIQVCLLPKPVNTILNILRSMSERDESASFQCSFSE